MEKIRSKVEVNKEILSFYKKIIAIRKDEITLRIGHLRGWINDNEKLLYGFFRETKEERIGILFNNGYEEQEFNLECDYDLIFGEDVKFSKAKEGKSGLTLQGKSFLLIKFKK